MKKSLPGESIRRVLREGLSLHEGWVILKALSRQGHPTRFGCTIRRKVFPSAVERNQVKRWFREAYRLHQQEFPEGLDLLAIIKHSPGTISYSLVEKTLISLGVRLRQRPSC